MRTIRVPLAVDAQVRVPVGPMNLPLRAVFLLVLASPLSILALQLSFVSGSYRLALMMVPLLLAVTFAAPTREGVWIGTYLLYKRASLLMPTAVLRGEPKRAQVRNSRGAVRVSNPHAAIGARNKYLHRLRLFTDIPTAQWIADGVFRLDPGGARAIVKIEGPTMSMSSEGYVQWCQQFMHWLTSVSCPAQFLTVMSHLDSDKAQVAFDRRVRGWRRTRLLEMERELAGNIARQSLGLQSYVVFAPGLAGQDGLPQASRLHTAQALNEAREDDAERILASALRLAPSFGVEASVPDRDDLAQLLSRTVLGANDAAVGDGVLHIGDQHHVVMTATKLPPSIEAGIIVEALMRSRSRGVVSLHILPVEPSVARKLLGRQSAMYKYAARQGNEDIDTEVAIQDTTMVLAAIAQRELKPMRIALTLSVSHHERDEALAAAERMEGILTGHGFDMVMASSPGFLPALALAPGGAPLGRSLQLTSDGVALRMLPALGTPFANANQPLVGINALTGAPAYMSLWSAPNHNLVIVGSSGAGKSVATKTLLIRHIMEGVSAVVIDPDSEYRKVMQAVGGSYFELGTDAINPLAAGMHVAPDTAASLVLPVLSVMGGDEKGLKDGRPIRRLPDEDQGWFHAEVAEFFRQWQSVDHPGEPVMSDLIRFIDTESSKRALTDREADRCRIITARLRRYTQGKRADVFDRPSTFEVGTKPVAIGLKVFAMSYGADLTPALAVVLTATLAAMERKEGRLIVVVDEAHRVTGDPDAGEVLGQLVRQARKYGAGVWMCSQRVEDFVHTELGKTLAATASTKLVLGAEEAALSDVAEVFKLRPEEMASIHPMQQGRGVLICGGERTVVRIIPGAAIMALADTSALVTRASAASAA